jgi:hypothetical protein
VPVAERPDHGVYVVRLDRGRMVDAAVPADAEQWPASVGGGQRATDVIGDVGPGGFERVRGRHDISTAPASKLIGPRANDRTRNRPQFAELLTRLTDRNRLTSRE